MKKYFLSLSALVLLVGCSSFDKTTFTTLSASNSVLKKAQADYESGTLPHNKCVFALINDGKAAQLAAQTAFLDYYQIEQAKGDVTVTESVVVADLVSLAPIVASIKTIYTNPSSCGA